MAAPRSGMFKLLLSLSLKSIYVNLVIGYPWLVISITNSNIIDYAISFIHNSFIKYGIMLVAVCYYPNGFHLAVLKKDVHAADITMDIQLQITVLGEHFLKDTIEVIS